MADFHIRVIVDPRQGQAAVKTMRQSLSGLERQGRSIGRLFKGALVFAGIGAGLRQITQLADRFTHLQNRLKTVTGDEETLVAVTERLFDVANKTRTPFNATAEIYTRVALAARELKTTQAELIRFTESLNKAVILSGATAQEAEAGMLQLSQGMASGSLRGEELRSVLEQIPVVADVIAKHLGVTRGELRKMGERGEITADIVLEAFKKARVELDERFAKTIPTIDQAFTILRNSIIKAVGEFNKGSGSASKFAGFIIALSQNADKLTEGLYIVSDVITATVQQLGNLFGPLTDQLDTWGVSWGDVFKNAGLAVLALIQTVATVFDKIVGVTTAVAAIIVVNFKGIPKALADIFFQAFNGVVGIVEGATNKIIQGINLLNKILPDFAKFDPLEEIQFGRLDNQFAGDAKNLGIQIAELIKSGLEQDALEKAVVGVIDTVFDKAAARAAERKKSQADLNQPVEGGQTGLEDVLFQRLLQQLKEEAELLKLSRLEREFRKNQLEFETKLNHELTDSQQEQLRAVTDEIALLKVLNKVSKEVSLAPLIEEEMLLTRLYETNRLSVEEYSKAIRALHIEMLELADDIDSGYARGLLKVQEQLIRLSDLSESVVTDAFSGMEQAIVDFVTTGEADLKRFVDQVLADLTRILLRWLILKATGLFGAGTASAVTGGGGVSLGGGVSGFQTGGSFNVGGSGGPDSQLVAFRATPGERVNITRPGTQPVTQGNAPQGQQSSQPIKIINTLDPSMALDAMSTRSGERIVMNAIKNNPQTIKRLLGG